MFHAQILGKIISNLAIVSITGRGMAPAAFSVFE